MLLTCLQRNKTPRQEGLEKRVILQLFSELLCASHYQGAEDTGQNSSLKSMLLMDKKREETMHIKNK